MLAEQAREREEGSQETARDLDESIAACRAVIMRKKESHNVKMAAFMAQENAQVQCTADEIPRFFDKSFINPGRLRMSLLQQRPYRGISTFVSLKIRYILEY